MMDRRAAGRYARALLGLVPEKQELSRIDRKLSALRSLLDAQPEFRQFLLNNTIPQKEKDVLLGRILPDASEQTVFNFLRLLIKKSRFSDFDLIQELFHEQCEKLQGIREVRLITAAPLSESNEKKLMEVLKKKLKSEIRLIRDVDQDIIGGMILRFEEKEINASYRRKLLEIYQQIAT